MHSAVSASRHDGPASRLILTLPLRAHPLPQPPPPNPTNLHLFVSLILPPKLFQTPNRAFASVLLAGPTNLPPSGDDSGEIPRDAIGHIGSDGKAAARRRPGRSSRTFSSGPGNYSATVSPG